MFKKSSARDRLVCFADIVGMTLLAVFFPLPIPNCFLRVGLPTILAAVLTIFLPLTTSTFSGETLSKKPTNTRFASETTYLGKTGIFPQKLGPVHRTPVHDVDQYLYRMESQFMLEQPPCIVFYTRNECWRLF